MGPESEHLLKLPSVPQSPYPVIDLQAMQEYKAPMDCSLPGSFIHGILQARVLEWGAIAFSICK